MEENKMKWILTFTNLIKGKKEHCPICGSSDISYTVNELRNNWGYGAAWCNKCKNGVKCSRMETTGLATNKEIPKNLTFI